MLVLKILIYAVAVIRDYRVLLKQQQAKNIYIFTHTENKKKELVSALTGYALTFTYDNFRWRWNYTKPNICGESVHLVHKC